MNYPYPDHTKLPGPLFRTLLLFVRQTSSTAAIINIGHSVIDKTSHQHFLHDVNRALRGESLTPHVSYKKWADEYHLLRRSPFAECAIEFHSKYLCDLKEHCHVLWPFPTYRLAITPERNHLDGHYMSFSATGLLKLCRVHPLLTPSVVIKSALALLVISRTNHTHALFGSFEASRSDFPFSSDQNATNDTMDIAGPVFNVLVNLVAFRPKESVLNYLLAMQQEQSLFNKHATVPWREVFSRIRCTDKTFAQIADALLYNWMPGLSALVAGPVPYGSMEVSQIQIRAKFGMLVNAGISQNGTEVILQFEGSLANRSTMWIERVGEELKNICLWLVKEESWSLPLENFTQSIF
ncbi:hypothetical protein PDIDSM_3524 [Penicillium digitatum]|nr:hypothetical protein PDIDSM_3524 [Penicillium digitatum]